MEFAGTRVLVTGGTGFMGSFLVEELLARGAHPVVPLRPGGSRHHLTGSAGDIEFQEGSLEDVSFCTSLLSGIDMLFHAASVRKNVRFHQEQAKEVYRANVAMTEALLQAHQQTCPSTSVVFFSSAHVPSGVSVDQLWQKERPDGYIIGKLACEQAWQEAAHTEQFPLLLLRPVGIYGPRDTFHDDANVIPSLMVRAEQATDQLTVWGDGTQERAFVYVEDVVKAVFVLLEAQAQGVQYITPGMPVSMQEIAQQIRDIVRPGLPIHFDSSKPTGERMQPAFSIHPQLTTLKWTAFSKGLERTYDWWKAHRQSAT